MSESSLLRRRHTSRSWVWFAFGAIVLGMVFVLFVRPNRISPHAAGSRGPTVRPQSDTRPMPPPAMARTRSLAV